VTEAEFRGPHPLRSRRRNPTVKTLPTGSPAPEFDLPDQDGRMHRLSGLLQRGPVVLFFYPAAGSAGCTREAVHFRDLATAFAAVGAQRVGISTDDIAALERFTRTEGLDFPLLSDLDGLVATAYGVRRKLITPVKRATFVIDQQQRIVDVIASETNMQVHADKALKALERTVSPA
jgi:peroxiredoxin Q/BCP